MKSNTLRIVIIVALIIGVAVVIASKEKAANKQPSAGEVSVATQPASEAKLPKMIELGSTTCTPCKAMEKVLDDLRESYPDTLIVEFIDIDKARERAQSYNITVIPTQVFLDAEGKEFHRHEGFFPKDDIVAVFAGEGIKLDK